MNGLLHLFGDALVAVGTYISERTAGFSERQAEKFLAQDLIEYPSLPDVPGLRWQDAVRMGSLCAPCPHRGCNLGALHSGDHDFAAMTSVPAVEEAAETAAGTRNHPGAGRMTGVSTSALITALSNQLQCWLDGHSMHAMRRDYLDELLDESRDRAAQYAAIRD